MAEEWRTSNKAFVDMLKEGLRERGIVIDKVLYSHDDDLKAKVHDNIELSIIFGKCPIELVLEKKIIRESYADDIVNFVWRMIEQHRLQDHEGEHSEAIECLNAE